MRTIEDPSVNLDGPVGAIALLEPAPSARPSPVSAPERPTAAPSMWRRGSAAREAAVVLGALTAYLTVRLFTDAQRGPALAHARAVLRLERALHLAHEQDVQRWVLGHASATSVLNAVYVWAFWPIVAGALVVLHRRAPSAFVDLRNALILSGLVGLLVFATFPVAPPRMLEGFHDTVAGLGGSHAVAHPSGLTNEYAAVPSFHVGWTALASTAVAAQLRRRRTRALALVPALLMAVAVVATGNHFVVDGLIGATLTLGTWTALRTTRTAHAARPTRALRRT